jgi:squalene-associated FAD-dependent desaturase
VKALRVAVVGGGWAGMAAAVTACQAGHQVTVFEATRVWGGRARALPSTLPDGSDVMLDNGQHILIGAYRDTLALMRCVGVEPEHALLRLPLTLLSPDRQGLCLPDWPMPLDVLGGIVGARGWSLADKWSLLRTTSRWQLSGFTCAPDTTVAELCQGLSPTVMQTLMEPLCVSALNTPAQRASGQVFLRVLKDALLGGRGSSNLLIPRTDLSSLLPDAAAAWLGQRGASLRLGCRVERLEQAPPDSQRPWLVNGEAFDAVLWATSPVVAGQLLGQASQVCASAGPALQAWADQAAELLHEGIATVYMQAGSTRLPQPMLALRSSADHPAQFVFDRGQLGGRAGLLACVVSASNDERTVLQDKVLQQVRDQLGALLQGAPALVQTVVEKRATFACTPGLQRPAQYVAPGLLVCGDYVHGPYPATLEGAVQSGMAAARALTVEA